MSELSLTYPTVIDGVTVVDAVIHNANFPEIQTAVNSIDHTNMGPAGIYASNLLPTTAAQATFGATATGVGYKFLGNDSTAVPLTISGVTSQTADLQDWYLTSGGTLAVQITAAGLLTIPGAATPLVVGTSNVYTPQAIKIFNGSAANRWVDFFTGVVTVNGIAATGFGCDRDSTTNILALNRQGDLAMLGGLFPGSTPANTSNGCVLSGTGSPSGSVTAMNGSLFVRIDGTHGGTTVLYVNSSGASTAGTTWTAIA